MTNKCSLCPRKHGLKDCPRFLQLTPAERQQKVQRSQHCTNCLARSHSNRTCDSRRSCAKCGRRHLTLLHEPPAAGRAKRTTSPQRNRPHRPSPPKQPGPDHQDSNLLGILSRKKMVTVSPTLSLQLEVGETKRQVTALLDPCTGRSSISEEAVATLNVECLNVGDERFVAATFHSLTTGVRLEHLLVVNGEEKSPTDAIPDHIRRHFKGLKLADPQFHRSKITDVVLGADVYPKVIRPEVRYPAKGFPLAQETCFGLVLTGRCPAT